MVDTLGDYVKGLENTWTNIKLDSTLPLCARIDGKAFHTFTKGLKRPYDPNLMELLRKTTLSLAKTFNSDYAYCQSDEASFVWLPKHKDESELLFGGKTSKLNSIFASYFTSYFVKYMDEFIPSKKDKFPIFDCRCFSLLQMDDVRKVFLWRYIDAKKNAVNAFARTHFSEKQLFGINTDEKIAMFQQDQTLWNEWSACADEFKYGTFIERLSVTRFLSQEELDIIPVMHRPTGPITRTEYKFDTKDEFFTSISSLG